MLALTCAAEIWSLRKHVSKVTSGFTARMGRKVSPVFLDSQGRSALLPDAIISGILEQLTVRITYEPFLCQKAVTVGGDNQNKVNCIIVDNTVTGTCTTMMARQMCMTGQQVTVASVANYKSISGTLSITNIVMANWSKAMWQSVMNRAVRTLAAGPL
ncbi:hypothetical protein KIN20_030523 [Parelaphostrongylus tenuis]|uniref:Uncharacterized protein n=1 Tax=Parelaphostrongylus tenuis TaxID=148309 RepID=A0AAD5WGG1_PARTN|nr:hypothetical protein KIN20_030523 [Parelaphostrongylus tenuis]